MRGNTDKPSLGRLQPMIPHMDPAGAPDFDFSGKKVKMLKKEQFQVS